MPRALWAHLLFLVNVAQSCSTCNVNLLIVASMQSLPQIKNLQQFGFSSHAQGPGHPKGTLNIGVLHDSMQDCQFELLGPVDCNGALLEKLEAIWRKTGRTGPAEYKQIVSGLQAAAFFFDGTSPEKQNILLYFDLGFVKYSGSQTVSLRPLMTALETRKVLLILRLGTEGQVEFWKGAILHPRVFIERAFGGLEVLGPVNAAASVKNVIKLQNEVKRHLNDRKAELMVVCAFEMEPPRWFLEDVINLPIKFGGLILLDYASPISFKKHLKRVGGRENAAPLEALVVGKALSKECQIIVYISTRRFNSVPFHMSEAFWTLLVLKNIRVIVLSSPENYEAWMRLLKPSVNRGVKLARLPERPSLTECFWGETFRKVQGQVAKLLLEERMDFEKWVLIHLK